MSREVIRAPVPGRWPHARALEVALDVVARISPACERIAVAGSLRRGAPYVKDIEIVAQPVLARDLFSEPSDEATALDQKIAELGRDVIVSPRRMADGSVRLGARYKALVDTVMGVAIDLFVVRPPAQWGAILAIRTGPHAFSQRLVTACQRRGLRCVGGRLVDARGRELATAEERDFFDACGVPWTEPAART